MSITSTSLLTNLEGYCNELEKEFTQISNKRKSELLRLSDYLSAKFQRKETPQIIVICTHNSRRSHLGQIWLAVGAAYYNLPEIATFSGGTAATAFNHRAVNTLQNIGFKIVTKENKSINNPIYEVVWNKVGKPYFAFSKKYDSSANPKKNFAALMVCSSADRDCPLVSGADFRLALPFEDPKAYDDTPLEKEKYAERCRQIGREMLFVLNHVK